MSLMQIMDTLEKVNIKARDAKNTATSQQNV